MLYSNIWWTEINWVCFNASGPSCSSIEELTTIWESQSWAIMMKTATLQPREWNPEPRYELVEKGSINSMWLPNLWYQKYIEFASQLKKFNKPIVGSLAGLSPDEFPTLVEWYNNSDVDMIELNFSCPNIPGKPQLGYDFQMMDEVLSKLTGFKDKTMWIKLPPYFDMVHFQQAADVIRKYENINFVTCINSVGNTLMIDPETEKPLIKPKWWIWGLGGEYVKPVALSNVRNFYNLIGDKVDIIGCGWVVNWTDAFEMLLAGASAVQIWTEFDRQWPEVFEKVNTQLSQIMDRKWYTSIQQVKGNLK